MKYKCNKDFKSYLGTDYKKDADYAIYLNRFNTNVPHLVVLTNDESCFLTEEELQEFKEE